MQRTGRRLLVVLAEVSAARGWSVVFMVVICSPSPDPQRSPSESRAAVAEECRKGGDPNDSSQRKASVERPVAQKGRNGDIDIHIVSSISLAMQPMVLQVWRFAHPSQGANKTDADNRSEPSVVFATPRVRGI